MKTPILALTTLLALPAAAHAVPDQLGLTARVADDGVPLSGSHAFVVSLHDAATDGNQVWTETSTVEVTDGLAYLTLGHEDPLDADILDGGPLWLELQVDGTPVEPRLAVTSAAYAIRAGVAEVAEDAELLGGRPASAFLPAGASLACTGTNKVSSIDPVTGSVVCTADVDTDTSLTLGGTGTSTTAARSDHHHTGIYVPINPLGNACTGTQKVTAVNPNGSVSCAADVDTDTVYSAGAGLFLSGGGFNVNFAGSGAASTVARADHVHAEACPSGYQTHLPPTGGGSALCSKRVTSTTTYSTAATACYTSHLGGQLCSYAELRIAATVPPTQTLTDNYWMGDRVADNWVLRVNGTDTNDFDEQIEIVATTVNGDGYYCCQRAH